MVLGLIDDLGYKLRVQVGNFKWQCFSRCLTAAPDVKTVG